MQDFNGSASGITARQQVVVSEPVGTDVRNSQSIRTPVEKLANLVQYLMQASGLLDAVSTWTAKQTFNAGLSSGVPPGAATDVARKTETDAEATARANADALLMPKAGGTFTGAVSGVTPTSAAHLTRKDYVDARFVVAAYVRSDGVVMSQVGTVTISLQSHPATGLYVFNCPGLTTSGIVLATSWSTGSFASVNPFTNTLDVNVVLHSGASFDSYFSILVIKL